MRLQFLGPLSIVMDKNKASGQARKETPSERTVRLLAEARDHAKNHENVSRSNQGKYQFSLYHKLKMTIPLLAIVFGLYGWSIIQTKRKYEDILERGKLKTSDIKSSESESEILDINSDESEFILDEQKW